jgi:hypothetical protein
MTTLKIPTILSFALFASACAHTSVYEVVAGEIGTLYVSGNRAYAAIWHPVGSTNPANLTVAEEEARATAIAACIHELKARVEPHTYRWEPDKIVATAELVSCMRDKSWSLTVEFIVVG